MKRTELTRKSPLKRGRMRRKPPEPRADPSAGELAWKTPGAARCEHCGKKGRTTGHHVVLARHVRARGGDVWDLRNRLNVLHACHMAHHQGGDWQKIDQTMLRPEHLEFARELLGDDAQAYLDKHYPRLPIPRLADEARAH